MLLIIRGVIGVVLIGSIRGLGGIGTLMGMPEMGRLITLTGGKAEYEMEAGLVGLSS